MEYVLSNDCSSISRLDSENNDTTPKKSLIIENLTISTKNKEDVNHKGIRMAYFSDEISPVVENSRESENSKAQENTSNKKINSTPKNHEIIHKVLNLITLFRFQKRRKINRITISI